jgi:hypothetical protein
MASPDLKSLQTEIALEEARLAEFDDDRTRVSRRISELKAKLSSLQTAEDYHQPATETALLIRNAPSTSAQKIALFMELFRGRPDVYPKLWINKKKGIEGYSPACSNKWIRGMCDKRKVKCGECLNQAFLPVTEKTIA